MGPAGPGELLLFLWFPELGVTCMPVGKMVRSQLHLGRLCLESAFLMYGLGQMRQHRAVLGLAGRGVPRQSKMAGARDGVESRSWSVESTVDGASQRGRRPKQTLKLANKERLGTAESVELVWLSMEK